MHRFNGFVLGAGLLLAATAPAFADGDDAAAGGGDAAAAPADPNAGGAGGDASGSMSTTGTAEIPMPAWPMSIIDRPYTLPSGMLGAVGDFDVARISVTVLGMTQSATAEGLHLGAGYGVNDKITAGLEYSFSLHDFEIKGPLTLYGAYKLVHSGKLSVAATAGLTIDFNSVDAMGMSTTSETLALGVGARYKATDKVAIFTGTPMGPGPVGQQLQLGFQSGAPITLDLLAGVGFQATPQLFAYASTNLAHINISNSANGFFGADFIPLDIGAMYSANKNLDVGAFLDLPDLKNAKFDVMVFGLGARYYQ